MAGLKKKTKEKSSSPNLVVVIFLVFFFLVSVGLGIWGYYGYAGQELLLTNERKAKAAAASEKVLKEYYSMQYRHLRGTLGEKLEKEEEVELRADLDSFLQSDYGKFSTQPTKEAARKLMDDHWKALGKAENGDYASDYPKKVTAAVEKAKEWEGKAALAEAKVQRYDAFIAKYSAAQKTFMDDANTRMTADAKAQTDLVKAGGDNAKKFIDNNMDLIVQLKAKDDEFFKLKEDLEKSLGKLQREYNVLKQERDEMAGAAPAAGDKDKPGAARGGSGEFPLILDVSPGKPLWDHPIGKVIRVELDVRQVTVNLGSAHGVRPELTFNIFGAGSSGRGEGQLKGSIEIIKVLDSSTSVARITSLYDATGAEILMNLQTRGRIGRETEAPIKEGDLLYNLFWGTRVAVAGYVSVTGDPSDNPAEQVRQMDDLVLLMKRNGMQVDAYVDLRDGQIVGKITSKTRYLIRGDKLVSNTPKAAKGEEGDKEPPKDAVGDRNDAVNKATTTLSSEAKDRGLFMISAENFAAVIGYRKARSANSVTASSAFRPGLPFAGEPNAGVLVLPNRAPPAGAEMPKKEN